MRVKLLNQQHPAHDAERLRRLSALKAGGPEWRALLEDWLPKRAVEPSDVHTERHALALYQNHAGPMVSLIAAMLFSDAPSWEGLEGDYWDGLANDCDGKGTPWRQWWRDRFEDAQTGRKSFVWVNLPARGEDTVVASRADEERAGLLDAYLVAFTADQVIDWETDARGRLLWLIAHDVVESRPELGAERGRVHRWRYIDAQVIRVFEWQATKDRRDPADTDDAPEVAAIPHGFGRVPVVALALPAGLWTMGKLEDAAVGALRARNEHTWALHQAANELLVIKSKWQDEKIDLGHGHYLKLTRDKDGEDSAEFAAPTGVAFQYLQQDVQDTREELFRVVQSMALAADSDAQSARLSGESKAMDWQALEIVLAAFQDIVLGAMKQALKVIAGARREDTTKLTLKGLEGWATEDLASFLEAVAMATDARAMSPTFRRVVAKREAERLLQDEVSAEEMQAIRDEIDAAPDVDPLFGSMSEPDDEQEDEDGPPQE